MTLLFQPLSSSRKSEDSDEALFQRLYKSMPVRGDETEPMMNIIAWRKGDELYLCGYS